MSNPFNLAVAQLGCGASKPAKKSKKSKKAFDERSAEIAYADIIRKNSDYAVRDGVLYMWDKNHHRAIRPDDNEGERAALEWLASAYPDKATPRTAKECFKAACMMARSLQQISDERVIIPLKNAYLEMKDDGTIIRMPPDRSLGITYVLDADLPGAGNFYAPVPVPAGSLLHHYFSTSLPDAEVRNYLQELAGDTLIPTVRFQVAALLKGRGRNGKSIYTRLMAALHQKTAPMRLNELRGFDLMPLIGASLAIVDEVPKSGMDEQFFKTLVSGEEITIDIKHRPPIRYRPRAKWIISTNNDQKTSDNSDGFWRRLAIVPFDHQIPEDQVIACLDEQIIKNELVQLVDWCLIGLQRLLQRGKLPPLPRAIQDAKQEAIEASNTVAEWFADTGPTATPEPLTPRTDIYRHYANWCDDERLRPLSGNQFWKALRALHPKMCQASNLREGNKRVRCVAISLIQQPTALHECPFEKAA